MNTLIAATLIATATFCADADTVRQKLTTTYHEQLILSGLTGEYKVEIYINTVKGTFTILSINPHNTACIRGGGKHLKLHAPKPIKKGTET